MEYRMLEALALRLTENSQGGHYFINLHTGRANIRFTWTVLLLPIRIQKLVRRLVRRNPIDLEVLDGLQYELPGANPYNDEADKNYAPG